MCIAFKAVLRYLMQVMDMVVATHNPKKLQEIKRILAGTGYVLRTLGEFPGAPEVQETEDTFEGNAALKARAIAAYTGSAALADDSGLEVFALHGAPGVFSARYEGHGASDRDNLQKLLLDMQGLGDAERGARFVCVLVLISAGGESSTFSGEVRGTICPEPHGGGGFGYDPVFTPEGHERTFAQMSPEEKDALSHRGRALGKLRQWLIKNT